MALLQRDEQVKSAIATPTVVGEITVEGQDVASIKFLSHGDQAGVCEIGGGIAVFMENSLNFPSARGELKRNLKCPLGNVCQDVFRRTGDPLQKITTFGDDRFAGHQRRLEAWSDRRALAMPAITPVEPSNKATAVKQNWSHFSGLFLFFPPPPACANGSRNPPYTSCLWRGQSDRGHISQDR